MAWKPSDETRRLLRTHGDELMEAARRLNAKTGNTEITLEGKKYDVIALRPVTHHDAPTLWHRLREILACSKAAIKALSLKKLAACFVATVKKSSKQ